MHTLGKNVNNIIDYECLRTKFINKKWILNYYFIKRKDKCTITSNIVVFGEERGVLLHN